MNPNINSANTKNFADRLKYYLNPYDGRYEDLTNGSLYLNIFKDFSAGLIVAMVAIPLAMGFAMASGLRPEQGIVGGAVAGLIGALFGGSKYQVYGPTAAFIPVIAGVMAQYDFNFLIWASVIAGIILALMGLFRLGDIINKVPHSIVVGFTIGISIVIALSQIGSVLGFKETLGTSFIAKANAIASGIGNINIYALIIALGTFLMTKGFLKISKFLPAPLIALGIATTVSATVWKDKGLMLIKDKYGSIPTDFLVFSAPQWIDFNGAILFDLVYFVLAIIFVSAVESLLCSRMADRIANNTGKPFDPNKELWGQGWVNMIIPIFNGFPHTGALARTATNIKVGAISPLAGIFKFILKLLLAAYLATFLEVVPMACIGGILMFIAAGMIKPSEIKDVMAMNKLHIGIMGYTAVMVVITDFLIGVLSAIVLYFVLSRIFISHEPEYASAD